MLLRITRTPYEEPYHVNLEIEASNTRQKGYLEYYSNASDLIEIGIALKDFPFLGADEYLYELGSEDPDDNFAHYLRLRFFKVLSSGASAIELRFSNNKRKAPHREITEFSIPCEVAGLNRLGKLFIKFGQLEHKVLEWDGIKGEVR